MYSIQKKLVNNMKKITWYANSENSQKTLYINNGSGWKPYTHANFTNLRLADGVVHNLSGQSAPINLSQGFRTMQKLLGLGYEMVKPCEVNETC